ncbi:MAG: hypothetical protein JRJ59_03375 [Deltaproteobacteria bacterium]|nr:hypothetical protein [Deltaproteobacteria bacterium]
MNSSLLELCNLIADEGVKYAHQHKQLFLEVVAETAHKAISNKQIDSIFKIFSFLNWAYANGVWSNLSNTTLRRDLMGQSMKSIVLKTAYELAEDKSNEGVAFLASGLDQEFRQFALAYNERIKELAREGHEPDANTATLYGLECIQEQLALNDDQMNVIVPQFTSRAGDVVRIEEIAKQVNRAASRRKKGFISRLFGS